MSTSDLERLLESRRAGGDETAPPADAVKLSIAEALAYRDAGNIPDQKGRSLRLVLHVRSAADLRSLAHKRLLFEPDVHELPRWRTERSKPVNVVPLRAPEVSSEKPGSWWTDDEMAALEAEWRATGRVYGVNVPAEVRGFVYKTATALASAGRRVTVTSLCDSIARWVSPEDLAAIRTALEKANR